MARLYVRAYMAIGTTKTVDWNFAESPEYLFTGEVPDNGVIHIPLSKCRLRISFPAGRVFDRTIDYAQISRYDVIDRYQYLMYVSLPR